MPWWNNLDIEFQLFLSRLFGEKLKELSEIQAHGSELQAKAFLDQAHDLTEESSKVVEEQRQAATATPTPSASPTPSPTSSATQAPTGHPSQRQQQLPDPETWADQAIAKFREKQDLTATPKDPYALTPQSPVWLSEKPKRYFKDEQGQRVDYGGIESRTLSDVSMDPYRWDAQKAKKMAELMEEAGMDTKHGDIRAMAQHWRDITITAANFWQVGKKVSPMDVLRRWADGGQAAESKTRTSTSTSVSLTNAMTAEQLAHAALSQRLGRRATKQEVADFVKELKAAEKKDPTTTTTTTTTDAQGNSSSSSTTKEGLNASAFAQDYAMTHNKDEAEAYQAAGIMVPWLFEALKSPV